MRLPVHSVEHQSVEALPSIPFDAGEPEASVEAVAVPVSAMSSEVSPRGDVSAAALPRRTEWLGTAAPAMYAVAPHTSMTPSSRTACRKRLFMISPRS